MVLRKKKDEPERRINVARLRAKSLSSHRLFEWVDEAIYTYGRCMKEAQEGDPEMRPSLIAEATVAAGVLTEIARELTDRVAIR
jgi:hypothetical protein